jgi:HTH-type transcriptional regulator, sugar sensing transcriptional regulator
MNIDIFSQIGLNNTELKVYFALLKLDKSTVGPIIKLSKIPDSKIYFILDSLKDKGLVSYVIKNKVKHYQANNPKNILNLIKEKEENLKNIKQELTEKIIPDIENKRKQEEDVQEAIVYESMEGVKSAFLYMLDVLKKGENYDVFVHDDSLLSDKNTINFLHQHHKRRIIKGIKVRLMCPLSIKDIFEKSYAYTFQKLKQFKYINQKLPLGTYIFNGHVMTVVWGEVPTAFVIKSKKNYQYYKDFFEEVWKKT